MKMINTSECESCKYALINDTDKSKVIVFCLVKQKEYYYGACIPCENYKEIKRKVINNDKS